MPSTVRLLLLVLTASIACAHGSRGEVAYREGTATTHVEAPLPDVVLTTHTGVRVRFADLVQQRTVVLAFGYVRCTETCPLTALNLQRVQRILGSAVGTEITLVTVTLDPEHDTPEVLARYAEEFDAGPGWLFLTGRPLDVDTLRRWFGLADADPSRPRTSHAALLVVGNAAAHRWFALPSLAPPREIAAAATRLSRREPARLVAGAPPR